MDRQVRVVDCSVVVNRESSGVGVVNVSGAVGLGLTVYIGLVNRGNGHLSISSGYRIVLVVVVVGCKVFVRWYIDPLSVAIRSDITMQLTYACMFRRLVLVNVTQELIKVEVLCFLIVITHTIYCASCVRAFVAVHYSTVKLFTPKRLCDPFPQEIMQWRFDERGQDVGHCWYVSVERNIMLDCDPIGFQVVAAVTVDGSVR